MSTTTELQDLLTDENVATALEAGLLRTDMNDDDGTAILRVCHAGDPEGENSYLFTTEDLSAIDEMDNAEFAEWLRDVFIELVEDDPDSYEDELLFYANLIAEA